MDWVQPIIQLTTAGGFGALVWYLIVKHLPEVERRHRDERREIIDSLRTITDKYDSLVREVLEWKNDGPD